MRCRPLRARGGPAGPQLSSAAAGQGRSGEGGGGKQGCGGGAPGRTGGTCRARGRRTGRWLRERPEELAGETCWRNVAAGGRGGGLRTVVLPAALRVAEVEDGRRRGVRAHRAARVRAPSAALLVARRARRTMRLARPGAIGGSGAAARAAGAGGLQEQERAEHGGRGEHHDGAHERTSTIAGAAAALAVAVAALMRNSQPRTHHAAPKTRKFPGFGTAPRHARWPEPQICYPPLAHKRNPGWAACPSGPGAAPPQKYVLRHPALYDTPADGMYSQNKSRLRPLVHVLCQRGARDTMQERGWRNAGSCT